MRYTCGNLKDYATIAVKLPQEERHSLCTDILKAMRLGFSGANYIVGLVQGPNTAYDVYSSSEKYDFDSLMGYDVMGFGRRECLHDLDSCPLAKYIDPDHPERGVERFPLVFNPSQNDVKWVRQRYPWRDSP